MIAFGMQGMFPCWKNKLYFYWRKAFKRRVLAICGEKKKYYRNHALSSSLQFERFDVNEKINNTMDGILKDKYDGNMCNIYNDAKMMSFWEKLFSDSMTKGMNE